MTALPPPPPVPVRVPQPLPGPPPPLVLVPEEILFNQSSLNVCSIDFDNIFRDVNNLAAIHTNINELFINKLPIDELKPLLRSLVPRPRQINVAKNMNSMTKTIKCLSLIQLVLLNPVIYCYNDKLQQNKNNKVTNYIFLDNPACVKNQMELGFGETYKPTAKAMITNNIKKI